MPESVSSSHTSENSTVDMDFEAVIEQYTQTLENLQSELNSLGQ